MNDVHTILTLGVVVGAAFMKAVTHGCHAVEIWMDQAVFPAASIKHSAYWFSGSMMVMASGLVGILR